MKLNCSEDKLNRSKHLQPLTKLLGNLSEESFVMTVSSPYGGGNSKKIIEDILVFDKERETELQIIKESMYELNTMDTFNSGPFYNDADEDF